MPGKIPREPSTYKKLDAEEAENDEQQRDKIGGIVTANYLCP